MVNLSLNGTIKNSEQIRDECLMAVSAIANVIKTSLGPVGLDKMLVDEIGEMTITNDGSTILNLLEIKHPAAKILVDLAKLQDKEIGDGTSSIVLIAAELIKKGNELINKGIHPTIVISGYMKAKREACRFIAEKMSFKGTDKDDSQLIGVAKTSISSKNINQCKDHFSKMVVTAMKRVSYQNNNGNNKKCRVKDIKIQKIRGDSLDDSKLVNGIALNYTKCSPNMPSMISNAKIALIDFDLRRAKFALGINVVSNSSKDLEKMRQEEINIIKTRINLFVDSGVNVIISSKGIDPFANKLMSENKIMAFKYSSMGDLKKVAKISGGNVLLSLSNMDSKNHSEKIDVDSLGFAGKVYEEKVGDETLTFFTECKTTNIQTMILRGSNDFKLDEIERSVHDCLCIVKKAIESNRYVPGGGAIEVATSVYLDHYAETIENKESLAISEYASALLTIPKNLLINGGFDSIELISQLKAIHHAVITRDEVKYKNMGLDLLEGKCADMLKKGILEPAISKLKSLRFATEVAVTILRIDEEIKMSEKVDPKRGENMMR